MPLTTGAIVLAGLSLVGIPGTAGFVSKWYLVVAALDIGWWWLAALIVLYADHGRLCRSRGRGGLVPRARKGPRRRARGAAAMLLPIGVLAPRPSISASTPRSPRAWPRAHRLIGGIR